MPPTQHYYAILGAGVFGIMCAATLYVVQHIQHDRSRHKVREDMTRLSRELAALRRELNDLVEAQRKKASRKERRSRASTVTSTSTDECPSADADSSDLEFYDVSDHEVEVSIVDADLDVVDEKLSESNKDEMDRVLVQLHNLRLEFPENPQLLWRLGKAHQRLFELTNEIDHLNAGIVACESALLLKPELANVHKWLAVLLGSRAKLKPIREKLIDSREFKKHLDCAIQLNPLDGILSHMLGRFMYDLADLSWLEKQVAGVVIKEASTATFDQAQKYFEEAQKLGVTNSKENTLFLAKCELKLGRTAQAVAILREADAIQIKNGVDDKVDVEVKELLKKMDQ